MLKGKNNNHFPEYGLLNYFLNKNPHLVAYCNIQFQYQHVNESFCDFFGKQKDEIIGKFIDEVQGLDFKQNCHVFLDDIARGKHVDFKFKYYQNSRRSGPVKLKTLLFPNHDKHLHGFFMMMESGSREVEHEKNDKNIIDRFVGVLGPDYFFYKYNKEGVILYISPSFERITGIPVEEVTGRRWYEAIPFNKDSLNAGLSAMHEVIESKQPGSLIYMKINAPQRQPVVIHVHGMPRKDKSGNIVAIEGLARNVTLQERLRDAYFDLNNKLRLALKAGGFGMWEYNPGAGSFSYTSGQWHDITGIKKEELTGFSLENWIHRVHDEDKKYFNNIGENFRNSDSNTWEVEFRYRHPVRKWIWLYILGKAYRYKENNSVKVFGCIKDITSLKNRERKLEYFNQKLKDFNKKIHKQKQELILAYNELKKTQEQLVHSEKMASLGTLAAGLAHEINNPLNYINAGLMNIKKYHEKVLKQVLENPDKRKDHTLRDLLHVTEVETIFSKISKMIDIMEKGIQQTHSIIKGLEYFYPNHSKTAKDSENINSLFELAITSVCGKTHEKVNLVKRYGRLPEISCFPGQLIHAFSHVLTNAIQASSSNDIIIVETALVSSRQMIKISVIDNGKGIPGDIRQRIFDPFFSTREIPESAGLGLYITYNIIKAHGGDIEYIPGKRKGSIFNMYLPV
ncbi:MAG: PAS domain-containing protein [Bacteroidales bacterium]